MTSQPIHTSEEFEIVTEAEADSRGRVALGRAGAAAGRRYRVASNADGVLLLTPVVSIPEREMLAWTDPELAQRVRIAVEHADAGETHDLGDFSQYLTAEDTED